MAEEQTVNTGNEDGNGTGQAEERTFTQAEVDAMILKRVHKFDDYNELKAKAEKYDEAVEAGKTELQKATEKAEALQKELDDLKKRESVQEIRKKVAEEAGDVRLAALLSGEDEETCKEQAKALLEWKSPNTIPEPKRTAANTAANANSNNDTKDSFRVLAQQVFGGN